MGGQESARTRTGEARDGGADLEGRCDVQRNAKTSYRGQA